MTPKSRKKISKYIWLLLAVSLAGLLISIVYQLKYSTAVQTENETVLSAKVQAENDVIKVTTKAIKGKQYLVLTIKEELKVPVAQVYTSDKDGYKGPQLGRVASVGAYDFPIEQLPEGILLYNAANDEVITKLMLE